MFTWKLGLWVFAGHLIPFQQIKQNHFNHSDKRKYQTISYENAESKRKFLVPDRYTTEKLHIFCCLHKHKHAAYQPFEIARTRRAGKLVQPNHLHLLLDGIPCNP
jgi:hypothetical protein